MKAEEAKSKRKSAVAALRKNLHKLKKDEEGVKAAARAEEAQKKKDEELFKVKGFYDRLYTSHSEYVSVM